MESEGVRCEIGGLRKELFVCLVVILNNRQLFEHLCWNCHDHQQRTHRRRREGSVVRVKPVRCFNKIITCKYILKKYSTRESWGVSDSSAHTLYSFFFFFSPPPSRILDVPDTVLSQVGRPTPFTGISFTSFKQIKILPELSRTWWTVVLRRAVNYWQYCDSCDGSFDHITA